MTCPQCHGTGIQPGDEYRLSCTLCSGRGVVDSEAPRTSFGATQRRLEEAPRAPSLGDKVSAHITHFPGVGLSDVLVLFALSEADAERMLQGLVEAHKVKEKDGLYYPV